jgi:hypothetical protein
MFAAVYNYLEALAEDGAATRIALQYGDSSSGPGYSNDATSFGSGAFACYRLNRNTTTGSPIYILIQVHTSTFGSGVGSPGLLQGSTTSGNGLAAAVRTDGSSPWNGTTNNDGTDTKGDPVWVTGSNGDGLIFPASNSLSGSHVTSKQNMVAIPVNVGGNANVRYHITGDEDSLVIAYDINDDGSYGFAFIGQYLPISGSKHEAEEDAIIMLATGGAVINEGSTYGPFNGIGGNQGGVAPGPGTSGVHPFTMAKFVSVLESSVMSNLYTDAYGRIEPETNICVISLQDGAEGITGQIDTIRETKVNLGIDTTNPDFTRAVIGAGVTAARVTIPWGIASAPKSLSLSGGVQY